MTDAVFFISFGGPEKPEDIRPFLDIVTRGRPIPASRIEEVVHHYERIGGKSPINEITNSQAEALRQLLNSECGTQNSEGGLPHKELPSSELRTPRSELPIYVGNRNWHPFIEDTLRKMRADGVKRAIGFCTAAQRSEASLERYVNAVETARQKIGPQAPVIDYVEPWFDHPLFIEAIAARAQDALAMVPENIRATIPLIYTAHSIPCGLAKQSTYVIELETTARGVTEKLGRKEFKIAYSSRSGNPRDPWLEPDICDEIRRRAQKGEKHVLVIPIGFIADHVEILFDLDVEAQEAAHDVGVQMYRAKSVGDHPIFIRMIAEVVRKRADQTDIPEMTKSATTRFQDGRKQAAPGSRSKTCYCQPDAISPPCHKIPATTTP